MDEKVSDAAARLREVAATLKERGTALLDAIDQAEACGVTITELDRNVIKVRLMERFPYMLEQKALALVPLPEESAI